MARRGRGLKSSLKAIAVIGVLVVVVLITLSLVKKLQTERPLQSSPYATDNDSGALPTPYYWQGDYNTDRVFTSYDATKMSQCYTGGFGYCGAADVNADDQVDAGDLSAANLCVRDFNRFPRCVNIDFNHNGRIDRREIMQISQCIFNQCGRDPNGDFRLDAADISYSNRYNVPLPTPTGSRLHCNACDFNYDGKIEQSEITDTLAQKCIFRNDPNYCWRLGDTRNRIYKGDANSDNRVDAGDASACALCMNVR
ncbi:hypothetical protein A2690_04300 [Candidatus Roizmanbacteria bacterium RIFCSPHIGHO2_01_FULL_39_12b]|uniref:EF-hand domain-containing protein n=1 Tax=Candidatus Roizmanbacteria bacterium RIFCSPHIGHO2_01_FULL_39_12b TaxID=1802030 RepID=A0A1F7GD69_9BACT|nr:MAG: hypothetical protein A2690_04300 [Candidatus Roizmanbacteria bacterium RIFCSPHIGHO2_01_FULL_39_12b]OGK47162.1 MAG: hypothetical protein A3B46_02025 [Candidatus Roizmanbacteria bacterium RIFCSPLOWO2_01_FULL_39_19]